MAFLFDTDAIGELLRPDPDPAYLAWIEALSREDQFTSAVCVGELFQAAARSRDGERHLTKLEARLLPAVTVLPYDAATARVFGALRAHLDRRGRPLPDADLQIAATAVYHGLRLVAGSGRRFRRVPGLELDLTLARARRGSG